MLLSIKRLDPTDVVVLSRVVMKIMAQVVRVMAMAVRVQDLIRHHVLLLLTFLVVLL